MPTQWPAKTGDINSAAQWATLVTPSDSANVSYKSLYVGGAGNVKVMMLGDFTNGSNTANVVFSAVPAGTTLPIRVSRIWATGTTATNIVGLD